jgi:uncharacterized protein YifN (PemK superfamily)
MATIPQIRTRLLEGFPEPQADLLAHVFVESHDALVTKAELNELTGVVNELAGNLNELAAAQKRTEWAVADLAKQVGGLSNALGGSLEDFACDLVPEILENRWQMVTKSAGPEDLTDGGRHREVDVVVRGEIEGKPVTVVCETKASPRFVRDIQTTTSAPSSSATRPTAKPAS